MGPLIAQSAQWLSIAAMAGGLFWLVWIYGNGLRDPRYLDGWVLAGGMALQISYHVAVKTARMSPRSVKRWRKFHVLAGYLMIAAFLSHCDFSLPDTGFEWALWLGFVAVTLSGILGAYLAWALQAKRRIDETVAYDRIPQLRTELARAVQAVVAIKDASAAAIALPGLPHDAWIADLYQSHLQSFFAGPRHRLAHLIGSQRPLKRLTDDIDGLSKYVDQQGRDKLAAIKLLVVEKDKLDFAHVHLGLSKSWLFVHVPITYGLIVLTVLHVIVVYAFSASDW